jgi:hypothetical protein
MNTCVICGDVLESAVDDSMAYTPYRGGRVVFTFGYGSCKFDLAMGYTRFTGVICDDCAEKCIERMECRGYDMQGNEIACSVETKGQS